MTPDKSRDPWVRLAAAARQVPEERIGPAPYGFATRVAALAFAADQRVASLLERFAFRAVGVACLLALCSAALNYAAAVSGPAPQSPPPMEDVALPLDDAIAAVLDFG